MTVQCSFLYYREYWRRIYRILHGKCARTVFTHELWRIRNRTSERSERVRFLIQNNECVNTVQSTFHVVLCLLYTYWDWTPSLNYDKRYLNNVVKQQSLKESSFVKSERAQIKSKTYEIKLAYLNSPPSSRLTERINSARYLSRSSGVIARVRTGFCI